MSPRPTAPRAGLAQAGLLPVLAGAALGIAGCSTAGPVPEEPESVRAAAAIDSPDRRLGALAELEAFDPVADPRLLDPMLRDAARIVDPTYPGLLQPGTDAFARASRPLGQLVADFPLPRPAGGVPKVSETDRRSAALEYAAARSARLGGDPDRAIRMLERAVGLDPSSPTLWSELGRACAEAGDRIGAADAFSAAVELGEREPAALLLLAELSASQQDPQGVVRWTAPVFEGRGEPTPARRAIAGAMLGSALLDLGNLRAGAEVLTETLRMFGNARDPNEPLELARLRGRATEFALLAGDAWAALGHPAQALSAYELGSASDDRVRPLLTQRRLASILHAGRPATAALSLLEDLESNAGDLGAEESRWIGGLGTVDPVRDALGDRLVGLTRDPARPLSVRRQTLRSFAGGWPERDRVLATVTQAGIVARSPVIAGDLLLRADDSERTRLASEIVASDPLLARAFGAALSRMSERPGGLASELIASGEPGGIELGLGVCLEIADARPALGVLSGPTDAVRDASLVVEAAGLLGRWDQADRWLGVAREQAERFPDRRPQFIGSLLTASRLSEAMSIADSIDGDADATADDLLAAAEVAFVVGDEGSARSRIERASGLDPFDERVLERRLGFANAAAGLDDGASLKAFGRELAGVRTRGALFALLRAREIGGRGRMREAVELIVSVGDREPARDLGVLLLAQASRSAGSSGDRDTQGMAIEWLRGRAERLPGSTSTAIAYAQALAGLDAPGALAYLDDAYARIGHDEIARAAEAMLATEPALRDDEDLVGPTRRVIERTSARNDPDSCIERAGSLVRFGDPMGAWRAASDALPAGGSLTSDQLERWSRAVELISRAVAGDATLGEVPPPGSLASVIDRAESQAGEVGMSITPALQQARLLSLVRAGDTERLESIVDQSSLGEGTGLLVVQALLAGDRVGEGIDLLGRLATQGDTPDGALIDEWARLVGAGGTHANVRALLGRLNDAAAGAVANVMRTRFDLADLPGRGGAQRDRADIAYTGGLIASVFGRDLEAEGMHRLTLELDPDHAWACNDLGYGLAERGVMLDEAERLTERSLALLGERASVIDSLGWVRYKRGVIDDVTGQDGSLVTEGAVTLLKRASELEDGRDNATILTHLGDALWRAGDRDGATGSWTRAEAILRDRASEIARSENAGGRASAETAERLNRVIGRLTDVKSDRTPRIDPLGVGVPDPVLGEGSAYD